MISKKIAQYVPYLMTVAAGVITVAAFFGYKCPAHGCPACKQAGL